MTSMPPQQAEAQRQRAWRTDERKAVIGAARTVMDRIRCYTGDDEGIARALRSYRTEVGELIADLVDAQREANRRDGDDRDGDALLAAWVAALREPREAAKAASGQYEKGDQRRGVHVRAANAYTYAIKELLAVAEREIATVRAEVAEAHEWLKGGR